MHVYLYISRLNQVKHTYFSLTVPRIPIPVPVSVALFKAIYNSFNME